MFIYGKKYLFVVKQKLHSNKQVFLRDFFYILILC